MNDQDNSNDNSDVIKPVEAVEDTVEVDEIGSSISADITSASEEKRDLKILSENKSRQLIETIEGSVIKRPFIAIDQIDGQTESSESTITFDLTISACQVEDAFRSFEENLCRGVGSDEKVPFISEVPSSEVRELNSDNVLYTLEVQVINEEKFLEKVSNQFESWDPLYYGKPRGKLVKAMRRM